MEIRDLEPKPLWNNFADLNAVPRPSKKEEKVIYQKLKEEKKKEGLTAFEDIVSMYPAKR